MMLRDQQYLSKKKSEKGTVLTQKNCAINPARDDIIPDGGAKELQNQLTSWRRLPHHSTPPLSTSNSLFKGQPIFN